MAVNKQAIKARIKSINATKKITSAMEMISNSKLAKSRNTLAKNKEYIELLQKSINNVMANNDDVDCKYLKLNDSQSRLFIVYSSDLGLCGGYNTNMLKLAKNNITKNDYVIVIGKKLYKAINRLELNVINDLISSDDITIDDINSLVEIALNYYIDSKISKIEVIYTEFINTVSFEPKVLTLLPATVEANNDNNTMKKETIFEPNAQEILEYLIPMMVQNVTYGLLLQTKTAEQASRRMAMENATSNAEELNDKLVLAYNQARQAAITQEITEIVAGADAI